MNPSQPKRRVAIVGSRDFSALGLVKDFINKLPKNTIVVSGGARGVDITAESMARKIGLEVQIYPAQWSTLGRKAGYARNETIVANSDEVVAFYDGKSRGTRHTINLAIKAGIYCHVIYDDNTVIDRTERLSR